MITMYKGGKACVADKDQVDLMRKAGWRTKPAKTSEPDGSGEGDGGEGSGGDETTKSETTKKESGSKSTKKDSK